MSRSQRNAKADIREIRCMRIIQCTAASFENGGAFSQGMQAAPRTAPGQQPTNRVLDPTVHRIKFCQQLE